jgi:hypothetical protein
MLKADLRASGELAANEPDIRLQVVDGGWCVHLGDAQYDTDHRGLWGSGSLTPTTNCLELARDLISDALDQWVVYVD